MLAGIHHILIAHADDYRQCNELDKDDKPSLTYRSGRKNGVYAPEYKRIHNYRYQEYKKHKRRSAARMKPGAAANIFDREFFARLVAGNALVLGSVIHIYPLYIGYQRCEPYIRYEKQNLDTAVDTAGGEAELRGFNTEYEVGYERRQPYEQHKRQRDSEHHRNRRNDLHHLVAQLLGNPLIELCLRLRLVDSEHLGRFGKRTHGKNKGFCKADYSPNHRQTKKSVFFLNRANGFCPYVYLFCIGTAHRESYAISAFHHNALHYRLTADLAETAACRRSGFICHIFVLPT